MKQAYQLSIIISTLNRAFVLRNLLEIFFKQEQAEDISFEIIVVDNGSTDDTASIVELFQGKSPNIKYLYEPRKGLSIARNTGARNAKGEILTFLDDDVVPRNDFVRQVVGSFESFPVDCAGGKITAFWPENKIPDWFNSQFCHVVGQTSFGEDSRCFKKDEFPFGGNISFRKLIFERLGGFSEHLGRVGDNFSVGEEYDLCYRMQKEGGRFYYNAKLEVFHIVGERRASKNYFLKSLLGKGINEGFQKRAHKGFVHYGICFIRELFFSPVWFFVSFVPIFSSNFRFQSRCSLNWSLGYIYFVFHSVIKNSLNCTESDKIPSLRKIT